MTENPREYDWNHYVRKWERAALEPSGQSRDEVRENFEWLYGVARMGKPEVAVCDDVDEFAYEVFETHTAKDRLARRSVESALRSSAASAGGLLMEERAGRRKVNVSLARLVEDSVGKLIVEYARKHIEAPLAKRIWNSIGVPLFECIRASFRDYGILVAPYPLKHSLGVHFNAGGMGLGDFLFTESLVKCKEYEDVFRRCAESFRSVCATSLGPDRAVVLTGPSVYRDAGGDLHREGGRALDWGGSGYYFLRGVWLDEDLYRKVVGKQFSFEEIGKIRNWEQRWVAYRYMEPDEFLKRTQALLLDRSVRGNELYLIENFFPANPEAFFVRYRCPSTGRTYIKGITADMGRAMDADLAQAWSFHLSQDEYRGLEAEA